MAVFGSDYGIDRESALKIASAFGGGGARRGDTCGAVTGALMVIGLRYGGTDARDRASREKAYMVAGEFMKRFRLCYSTLSCRELIGFDIGASEELTSRSPEVIAVKCPKFIHDAVHIVEEVL